MAGVKIPDMSFSVGFDGGAKYKKTVDGKLSPYSENPVQNKAIYEALEGKQEKGDYVKRNEVKDISSVSIGAEEPTDGSEVWIDTDEESEVSAGGLLASLDVTARVGQTIIVKEVDANGKPTKWESADLPREGYVSPTDAYNGNVYLLGASGRSGVQSPVTYEGAYMSSDGTLYSGFNRVLTTDDLAGTIVQTTEITPGELVNRGLYGETLFLMHVDNTIGAYLFSSFAFDYMKELIICNAIITENGVPTLLLLIGDIGGGTWQMTATPLAAAQ